MNPPGLLRRFRLAALLAAAAVTAVVGAPLAASEPASELDRGRALQQAGERPAAVAAYRAFLDTAPPAADEAVARNNLCVLHDELGDAAAALAECGRALALRRDLADEKGVARTLNNLGLVLRSAGRLDEARAAYAEAAAVNERRQDLASLAVNLANLGTVEEAAGRLGAAMALHRRVETLAGEHRDQPWAAEQERIAWMNQGVVLERLGAFRQALELYQRVLPSRDALPAGQWASARVNTGVLYRNLGDPLRAVEAFEEAAAVFEAEGDLASLSNALLNLGQAKHLDLRDPAGAAAVYARALELARRAGDRVEETQDLFLLGRLHLETGDLDGASLELGRALELATASGIAEGVGSARFGLGRLAALRGDLDGAATHLEAAIEAIEAARAEVGDRALRDSFFVAWSPIYRGAVEVLGRLHAARPTAGFDREAFRVAQRAKARELVEAMGRATPRGAGTAFELDELRSRLDGSPLLEYYVAETTLFGWRLDTSGLAMAALGPAAELEAEAMAVHRALAAGQEPSEPLLRSLGERLLGPFGELAADRLFVAADGRLRALPFDLLSGGDGAPPLVERTTLVYLPSASALVSTREDGRGSGFVGFAAPVLPEAGDVTSPSGLVVERFALGPLPAGEAELERAAARLPGESALHVGREATEEVFRRAGDARVLHFATHTVADERPGGGSAIVLAAEGDDDGLLTPPEIAARALSADLTVLAACSSALAEDERAGEARGVLGSLTGAFLAAGSGGVVASLWDVGDQASAVVMDQLYFELGRGVAPADALARVKRRLRADPRWRDPSRWAAWIVVGDPPPVARRRPWALLGSTAVLAVAILVAWWMRRRVTARPSRR